MGRPPAKGGKDRNESKSENIRRCWSIARRSARRCPGIRLQKAGGILKMYTVDSPVSAILEEATVFAERPMMGIFNNSCLRRWPKRRNDGPHEPGFWGMPV